MNHVGGYIYLILAIILGISSNSFLKVTNNFTNIYPTIFCIITIISCIFYLSKTMSVIPISFAMLHMEV
jgi:small multidrug resistance pump